MSQLNLTVDPADALIDVTRRITVSGAGSGATITLVAETTRAGRPWSSKAVFEADASGTVDLTRDAPVTGSYAGVSPMGPIWSQTPDQISDQPPDLFNKNMAEPAGRTEPKRRTVKATVFPCEDSLLRLVSAVLVEIDEKCASDTKAYLKWECQVT